MLKKLSFIILLLGLSSCGSMKIDDFAKGGPKLDLFNYFEGEVEAWGVFEDRFGDIRRQFYVKIDGTVTGDTLVLDEDFSYADGEESNRVWTIKRTGDNLYEGTAPDVIGTAKGKIAGNAMNWSYDIDLVVGESSYRVKFDDWLFLQEGDVLINIANVTKWGIDVGRVTLFFKKVG